MSTQISVRLAEEFASISSVAISLPMISCSEVSEGQW